MNEEKQLRIDAVTKAIAYAENGGKPDINNPSAGKTGEAKSIFQFMPATWKIYAKEALGDPNAPITADNELEVVRHKVGKWIDKGHTVSEIASMWNAGEARPDAYKQNWKGENKGVSYDTPAYAKKVLDYSKQFYQEKQQQDSIKQVSNVNQTVPISHSTQAIPNITQVPQTQSRGLLPTLANPLI